MAQIANSNEQSSSWEASNRSRIKKFFELYGTQKFITMFTKISICSYLEPDQTNSIQGVHKTKALWIAYVNNKICEYQVR
jgi:hypothetical protein